MVAPTAYPVTGLTAQTGGEPVVVWVDGDARAFVREVEIFELVGTLVAACRASRKSLLVERVRLGSVLNQLADALPWDQRGGLYAALGIHPKTGQQARRLAAKVADERGVIDEGRVLAAVRALREERQAPLPGPLPRGEREEDAVPTGEQHTGSGEKAGAVRFPPERVDECGIDEVEIAFGLRADRNIAGRDAGGVAGRIMSLSSQWPPARAGDGSRGGSQEFSLGSPRGRGNGVPRGEGDGVFAPGGRGDAEAGSLRHGLTGPQRSMAELYEMAERVAEGCERVCTMGADRLSEALGRMSDDELENVLDVLETLSEEGRRDAAPTC